MPESPCLGLPTPLSPTHLPFQRILLLGMHFLNTNQSIQSAYSHSSLLGSHTSGCSLPAFLASGLGTRRLGAALKPQRPVKLFKAANPKTAYPVSPTCHHNFLQRPQERLLPKVPLSQTSTGASVRVPPPHTHPVVWHASSPSWKL